MRAARLLLYGALLPTPQLLRKRNTAAEPVHHEVCHESSGHERRPAGEGGARIEKASIAVSIIAHILCVVVACRCGWSGSA